MSCRYSGHEYYRRIPGTNPIPTGGRKPVKTLYQLVRPNLMFQVPNTVRHPTLSTPPPLYPRRRIQTAAEQPDSGDNGECRYAETGLPVDKGPKTSSMHSRQQVQRPL